ncbi:MAG: hypothetical protein ACREFE_03750 [Limisphaerales bacterium]
MEKSLRIFTSPAWDGLDGTSSSVTYEFPTAGTINQIKDAGYMV